MVSSLARGPVGNRWHTSTSDNLRGVYKVVGIEKTQELVYTRRAGHWKAVTTPRPEGRNERLIRTLKGRKLWERIFRPWQ